MGSWKDEVTIVNISQQQVDASLQCYICLEDLVAGEVAMRLSCSHHYHEPCISPWLEKRNVCPTCRQKILSREDPVEPIDEEIDLIFDPGSINEIIREIQNIMSSVLDNQFATHPDLDNIIDALTSDSESEEFEFEFNASEDTTLQVQNTFNEPDCDVTNRSNNSENTRLEVNQSSEIFKRERSPFNIDNSSCDEDEAIDETTFNLQAHENVQNSQFRLNNECLESVNRFGLEDCKEHLQKRHQISCDIEDKQESSDEELELFKSVNNEDLSKKEFRDSKVNNCSVKANEITEGKKFGQSKYLDNKQNDIDSDDEVLEFDLDEVESLVSEILEIMNQGDDENISSQEDVSNKVNSKINYVSQVCKNNILKANTNPVEDDEEVVSSEDENNELDSNYIDKTLSELTKILNEDSIENEIPKEKQLVKSSKGQRNKENQVKASKRKLNCTDNESSTDEDTDSSSDYLDQIEPIISELWSIVGDDCELDDKDSSQRNDSSKRRKKTHRSKK